MSSWDKETRKDSLERLKMIRTVREELSDVLRKYSLALQVGGASGYWAYKSILKAISYLNDEEERLNNLIHLLRSENK
jgi:hypothetical protein